MSEYNPDKPPTYRVPPQAPPARYGYYVDSDLSMLEKGRFFDRMGVDVTYRGSAKYNLPSAFSRMTNFADQLLDEVIYRRPVSGEAHIAGRIGAEPVYIEITRRNNRGDDDDAGPIRAATMYITGSRSGRDFVLKSFGDKFAAESVKLAKWWMQGSHGIESKSVFIPPVNGDIRPCLYPDTADAAAYMTSYLRSSSPVLLMQGPPGTGKTSLLRHLVVAHNMYANVVYDETLLKNDSLFHSFLFDNDSDILIVEDADAILMDRERDGNKLMARFLNISDGLIKLPEKKIVFTTNLSDFSKVDEALLRPGRCFGVLHTRALNLNEAQVVAKEYDLPIPTEKKEYTLADLFNQGQGGKRRQVGFGIR